MRHQLHLRAFAGITGRKEAQDVRGRYFVGHCHSGLSFREGDDRRMADFAFETDNSGLWAAFWSRPPHGTENLGPDLFRRRLREQALAKPSFMAEWARLEQGFRAARKRRVSSDGAVGDAAGNGVRRSKRELSATT